MTVHSCWLQHLLQCLGYSDSSMNIGVFNEFFWMNEYLFFLIIKKRLFQLTRDDSPVSDFRNVLLLFFLWLLLSYPYYHCHHHHELEYCCISPLSPMPIRDLSKLASMLTSLQLMSYQISYLLPYKGMYSFESKGMDERTLVSCSPLTESSGSKETLPFLNKQNRCRWPKG